MKNYKEIFNPSKITISGKSNILTTKDDKYVIKEKNKDLKSLFEYLNSRNFNKYPKIIDEYDNKYVYEYVKDVNMPINQKIVEEAKTLAELHYKTSYFKNIKIDDIKKIYEDIKSNILYIEDYYNRQHKLINRQIENYINKTYVDIKDFSEGDKNLFYLNSAAAQSNETLDQIKVSLT